MVAWGLPALGFHRPSQFSSHPPLLHHWGFLCMRVDDPAHMAKLHLLTHTPINSALAMSGDDGSGNWPTQALELGLGPYGQGFLQVWVPIE